jgi:hypothetical protein
MLGEQKDLKSNPLSRGESMDEQTMKQMMQLFLKGAK